MRHPRLLPLPRHRSLRLALASLVLASAAAHAEPPAALDRVSVWVGGYQAQPRTTLSASDHQGRLDGTVNLERDLDFNGHQRLPRVRLDFLIGDRQGFSLDYYSVNRDHGKSVATAIPCGDSDCQASATLRSRLNFDFGSVAYRWWFGDGNNVVGLGLGGAYYRVHARLHAEAHIDDDLSAEVTATTDEGAWAPMLQLGWRYAFNDHWRMYADAAGVKKNGGRLSGNLWNAALGLEWFPWQHVGVGAEYGVTRIQLNQHKDDYDASLDMKLDGPSLFMRFRW